jgi:hypothetical protein
MLSIFNTTISIKRKNILFKHHNFLYFDMIFLNRKNNYFWRKTTVALLVVTQKDDVQSIFCFNFKCDSTFTSDVCCSIKRRNKKRRYIKRRYKMSLNKAARLLNFSDFCFHSGFRSLSPLLLGVAGRFLIPGNKNKIRCYSTKFQ